MNELPYRVPGERGPSPEALDWTSLKEIESISAAERTVFNGVRLSKTGLYYSFKWMDEDGPRPRRGWVVICRKDGARLKTHQVIELEEYPNKPTVEGQENGDFWIICDDEKLVYKYEHDEYAFKEKAKFSPASKFVYRDGVAYSWRIVDADSAVLSSWQEGDSTLSLDQVLGTDLRRDDYISIIKDRFDSKHLLMFLDTHKEKSFKVVEMGEAAKILESHDIGPDDSLNGTAQLRNGDLVVGNAVWKRKPDGDFEMSQRLSYGARMAGFVIETTDGHLVSAFDNKVVIWEKESGSEEYKICNVISNQRHEPTANVSWQRVMEIMPGMIAVTGRDGVVRVLSAS